MSNEEITKRIDSMEALATLLLKEASQLRKDLGLIQAPAPRKGAVTASMQAGLAMVLAKRNARMEKKKEKLNN